MRQPIVLGKNAVCVRCNEILPRGKDAAIGDGNPRLIVCAACLQELRSVTTPILSFVSRLDALSLDLARDLGKRRARDAQAFAGLACDRATTLYRATPRAARLAQAGAALLARQRWLRLVAVAKGGDGLRADDHRDLARRATAYACELRGGIAKLGQLAGCRPDLVGPIWASELARLQDEVPPVATDAIRARVEAELGRPIAALFATFDDTPLAAASLAQVHTATLHDGTRVVVKVQVPGIEDVIAADIAALRAVATAIGELPGVDLATLSDELSRALATELDYLAEADALRAFAASGVRVPRPVTEATTARVLTMTRIDGERLHVPALERLTAEGKLAERDRFDREPRRRDRAAGPRPRPRACRSAPGQLPSDAGGRARAPGFRLHARAHPRPERRAYAKLVLAIAGKQHAARRRARGTSASPATIRRASSR